MIATTEAVVLRTQKYRETSLLVTLYTRRFGRLSAVAKGARDRKSKFGAALQPMSHVQAVLYKKEQRDLHLLSQCDVIAPMRALTDDLARMAAAMGVVELLNAVAHDEEENAALFGLAVGTLGAISSETRSPRNTLYAFEVRLLEILGFRPNFSTCARCNAAITEANKKVNRVAVEMGRGGLLCASCSATEHLLDSLSLPAVRVLQRLQDLGDIAAAGRIVLDKPVEREIARTLRLFLQRHVEGLRPLRSEEVFSAIL